MKPVTGINHIGIAVRSLDTARALYEGTLGLAYEGDEVVADQRVRVGFFRAGDVRIELLEPTDETSPVHRFIEKRGEGIHHIAYSVEDLPACLEALKQANIQLIDDQPRAGAHQTRIVFLHPKSTNGVLTELCESVGSNG